MSRYIRKIINDVRQDITLNGNSVQISNSHTIDGHQVSPFVPGTGTGMSGYEITGGVNFDTGGTTDYPVVTGDVGVAGAPPYNYEVAAPSHESVIIATVRRKYREAIRDYSQENLEYLEESGARVYAQFDDGTELEVTWPEVFNPRRPARTTHINIGQIAEAANQHFWTDTNGAHVTSDLRRSWDDEYAEQNHGTLAAPTLQNPWHNILLNSMGILLRKGLINLAAMESGSIAFYDGQGNNSSNINAVFGSQGAQIGKDTDIHVVLDSSGLSAYDANGDLAPIQSSNIAADYAEIRELKNTYADIFEAYITYLDAGEIEATDITAMRASVNRFKAGTATVSDLTAMSGFIDMLVSHRVTSDYIEATYAEIEDLNAVSGKFDNVKTIILAALQADIDSLTADEIEALNITAVNAAIDNLETDQLSANDLTALRGVIDILASHRITTDILEANYAQINLANVNNAWIANGVIKQGAIADAQIIGVSANKLTAGEINADEIMVRNLRAENLKVGRLNGQPVIGGYSVISTSSTGYAQKNPTTEGWYEYVNGAYVLSQDTSVRQGVVYYTQDTQVALYDQTTIDGMFDNVDRRIDAQIQTHTGSAVPTLSNSPASSWNTNALKDEHIGDIYYVINAGNQADGYTYRFAYDNATSSYKWILIKDNQVTAALQDLIDVKGDISGLQEFQSDTTSWINETDEGLETIRQNHSTLVTNVNNGLASKVDTTTFNTVANEVHENSSTITTLSTRIDDIKVGGRNLLRNTLNLSSDDAYLLRCTIQSNGIVRHTSSLTSGGTYLVFKSSYLPYSEYKNNIYTLSLDVRLAPVESEATLNRFTMLFGVLTEGRIGNSFNSSYDRYAGVYVNDKLTSSWKRFYLTLKIPEVFTSNANDVSVDFIRGVDDALVDSSIISVQISASSNTIPFETRRWKLEVGNKATDWTPAPEDMATAESITTITNTVNEVKQTADSNSSTITTLTTTTTNLRDDFDNLSIGGKNLILGTANPVLDTATRPTFAIASGGNGVGTIETITDSPIPQLNKSFRIVGNTSGNRDFQQMIPELLNEWDGSEWRNSPFTFSAWARSINGTSRAYIRAYGTVSNSTTTIEVDTSWTRIVVNFVLSGTPPTTRLSILFGLTGTGSIEYIGPKLEYGNRATDWTPAPEDMASGDDLANEINQRKAQYAISSTASGTAAKVATCNNFVLYPGVMISCTFTTANTADLPTLNINNTGAKQLRSFTGEALSEAEYKWKENSTYNLVYDGAYWRIQDSGATKRLTTAETKIDQNSEAITLRATKTEVSDAVADIQVGGTNLLRNTLNPTNDDLTLARATIESNGVVRHTPGLTSGSAILKFKSSYLPYSEYKDNVYTFSLDARLAPVESEATLNRIIMVLGVGIINRIENAFSSSYDKYTSVTINDELTSFWKRFYITVKIPEDCKTGKNEALVDSSIITAQAGGGSNTLPFETRRWKLEVGNKATAWTPAPEDMQTVTQAQAELEITNQAINSKVSQTDYTGATVASMINQSADSVKIQAKHVEIDGTAIFNNTNFQSSLTEKLDDIQIGGRNLLRETLKIKNNYNIVGPRCTVLSKGILRHTPTTSSAWMAFITDYLPYPDYQDKYLTLSVDIRAANVDSDYTTYDYSLLVGVSPQERYLSGISSTYDKFIKKTFKSITNKWTRVSLTCKIPDDLNSGTDTALIDTSYIKVHVSAGGSTAPIEARRWKLEVGNKATQWTPAPEDSYTNGLIILWNSNGSFAPSPGESYICEYDNETNTFLKNPGWVIFNGYKRTVPLTYINLNNTVLKKTVWVVCRLDSADSYGPGTCSCVWYDGGWKYLAGASGVEDWTWVEDTDIVLGSFVMTAAEAISDAHQYDPPLTYLQVTNGVSSHELADNAAPKTTALKRSQRIYYRSNSSSKPTIPASWVSEASSNVYNDWSTKVAPIAANKNEGSTKYLYLYTCEQRETVSGTYSCTTVQLDENTTVIDGGNVITHSITATQIDADSINASNMLTVGSFDTSSINVLYNWYATCSTEADTATKVATITPATTAFSLTAGIAIKVKFSVTNTAAVGDLKLAVNGTTAKAIKYTSSGGGVSNLPSVGYLQASRIYDFIYDGSYWVLQYSYNSDTVNRVKYDRNVKAAGDITSGHIICGTASGYQNIAASVSFDLSYPLLYAATTIASGATTGTLNNNYLKLNNIKYTNNMSVQGAAADKVVYLKGTISGTTFTIAASNGLTCTVPTSASTYVYIPLGIMQGSANGYFDSSREIWGFIDGAFGPAPNQQALASAKTATNYITQVDNNGIKVHAVNNTASNYSLINASGMTVYKGGSQVAQFGDTILLGSTSGQGARINSDGLQVFKGGSHVASFGTNVQIGKDSSTRITLDDISFLMYDRNNNNYIKFEDMRNSSGQATITEKFRGDGSTKTFYLSVPANTTSYEVIVGETVQTSGITYYTNRFVLSTAPPWATADNIIVTYTTTSHLAKSFTIGTRSTSDPVGIYSTTFGYGNEASGAYSVAEGKDTNARGKYSHAEGEITSADGECSHAEGTRCTADGLYAHAEGASSKASGIASHASGATALALGDYAHACGCFIRAYYDYQFCCGKYNSNSANDLFEIGNGTAESSRANAFKVTTSNTAYFGSTLITSDERVKEDIEELNSDVSYNFIQRLKPKSYKKFGRKELGFIAQDIEKLVYGDILVDESPNFGYDDFKDLSYDGLIAPLVSTVQTLQKENEELKQKNEELEQRLAKLEAILLKDGDI